MRKKWFRMVIVAVAFTVVLVMVINVNGSNHIEQKLEKYLLEKNVSYTSVDISDNILRMNFKSEGADYCTADEYGIRLVHSDKPIQY